MSPSQELSMKRCVVMLAGILVLSLLTVSGPATAEPS